MGAKKSHQSILRKSSQSDINQRTPPQTTSPNPFQPNQKPKFPPPKTKSKNPKRGPLAALIGIGCQRPQIALNSLSALGQKTNHPRRLPCHTRWLCFLMATPSVSPRLEALRSSWTAFRRKGMGRITEFPTRIGSFPGRIRTCYVGGYLRLAARELDRCAKDAKVT